ncbi:MAG TPA: hypothetical protein DG048_18765 [Pseudoalteromonas sp.]|nr:hypothetical protein [Pseudoalteromonas sp.]|tara:strand:- start:311 stop:613 length:303 start_codon:yes stop_codon:yes gene_type:complete
MATSENLARSYRATKIDDNLSLHINIRFLFHLFIGISVLVSTYLNVTSSIAAAEYRIASVESRVADLEARHNAEIIEMKEELKWYKKDLNPLNWRKKKNK